MSKNYNGKLNIDVSGFNKAIKEAKTNLALATSELKLAKEQGSVFESLSEKLNRTIQALNRVYDENNKKTLLLEEKYKVLKNELGETNEKVIAAKKAWIDSKTETEKVSKEINRYSIALKENKDITNDYTLCNEELCHALTGMQEVIIDVSEALCKKLATALVDFTKETVNAGLQFETAFAGVKKVVDGTNEDFERLQSEIRKTATEKPISADTLASLYQMGAQLGIDKNNLKDFTDTIIDLKNTSDLTEEAGAEMIAQYANVMKLPYEDYRRFGSTLSYLGSTTATTESKIMELAQRMSGSASIIGMTNQGVLALATSMGSVGINAEMGGSAISTIMLNIEEAVAKNNQKLKVWADTAKMSASEFSKLWRSDVASAMQAVIKGLADEKAGGESLVLTLEELGIKNIRQKSTMLQLASASELFTETFKKANEEWERNTFLTDSANKVYQTTANQMTLLQNSFKEVQLSIYDDLAIPLQDVTKDLTEFLKSDKVKAFSREFAVALTDIGKIVSSIIKFTISNFDKIVKSVKIATPIITHLFVVSAVNKYKEGLSNLITGFKNLIPNIKKAILGQESLNIAMSSNPIGAVLTLISLLINGYLTLNALIGESTNNIYKNGYALSEIQKQILENNEARNKEIAGIDSEYNHYQSLVDELKILVDENGNVKAGYEDRVNAIIPILQNATGEEIKLINNQIQGYNGLITKLDEVIAKKRAEAKMSAYEDDYKEALKNKEELANKKAELEEKIAREENMSGADQGLKSYLSGTTISDKKHELEKTRSELADINAQIENGTSIIEKYESMLADYTATYVNKINEVKSAAESPTNNQENTIASSIDERAIENNAIRQATVEANAKREAELALQEETLLPNANQDALNKQVATLDPSNLEIYDNTNRMLAEQEQISHAKGLNDNAYRVVDAEVATLNQAKQTALNIDFTCIGLYICQGIVNGINANKGMVISAVRAMMEEANDAAEDEEDINSPSGVFMKYGYYMDKGLELGIKNNSNGVINNIKEMMAKANSIAATNISGLGKNVSNTIKGVDDGIVSNNQGAINYYITQTNNSNKSLDTLAIYNETKSLLKRVSRDRYV